MLARVSHLPEVASVASPYLPGGKVQVSPDGRTAYATVNFTKSADNLDTADISRVIAVATAAREPGLAVELGGQAISHSEQAPLSAVSAIGIGAAAVILLVAFGSLFAMALPIATAVAGVGSGLMLMAPLSHLTSVTGIAPILGALIGLGVGVDYALFIVTRHRRGLQSGLDPERSAVPALNTSGRAVLFAGGTVCIALLGLLTLGLGFLDGLAVRGGDHRGVHRARGRHAAARAVRRARPARAEPQAAPQAAGRRAGPRAERERHVGALVAHRAPVPRRARRRGRRGHGRGVPSRAAPAAGLCRRVQRPHVEPPVTRHTRCSPTGSGRASTARCSWSPRPSPRPTAPRLTGSTARSPPCPGWPPCRPGPRQPGQPAGPAVEVTQVLPATAPEAQATSTLITRLRNTVIPRYTHGTTLRVYVGGLTATFDDFAAVTSAKLPWLLAAIAGFSFLLLVLAFRSLLIPAITAVLNLLSAAASFGVLTAFFQWGWGTRAFGLGAPSPGRGLPARAGAGGPVRPVHGLPGVPGQQDGRGMVAHP